MTKTQKHLMKDFLSYETLRGKRERSLNRLKYDLKYFFNFLEEQNKEPFELKVKDALAFQGYLQEQQTQKSDFLSRNTIANCICAATCFFNYLKKKKKVLSNPFYALKTFKRDLKLPRNVLKEKEMFYLLSALQDFNDYANLKEKKSWYRFHVICELMYSTGMRISEVCQLEERHIDLNRNMIFIEDGKGGKSRSCYLNEYASSVLKLYLDLKPYLTTQWHKSHKNLFGLSPDSLSKFVNSNLKKKCDQLKLPVQTSHCFRHAVGFHFLRAGCDIRFIQMILGHQKLHTTEIYTKVEKEDLKNVLDQYHPRRFGVKSE
jgi:site-specific recombinase XerD